MRSRGVSLPVWAGLLGATAVVTAVAVSSAALAQAGLPLRQVLLALAAGAAAGLLVVAGAVLAARHVGRALQGLNDEALRRLAEPGLPVHGGRRLAHATSLEVGELARTLDALHLRVRMADQVGEQHRRQAETAGAGVFELVSGLVAAEEGARGQLAAELHDSVAQSLMIARSLLAGPLTDPDRLARVRDHVDEAEEQIRAVMARTRPPALRDGDLASAVGGLRLDLEARYGLEVQISWPPSAYPLPLASAITVYRFFQEALLNVVKHADVDEAEVALEVREDVVVATVRDRGPGFDPGAVRPQGGRHVGLGLLQERARLSGGRLDLVSEVGDGTTLTLMLPRPQAPAPEPVVVPAQPVGSEPMRRVTDPVL